MPLKPPVAFSTNYGIKAFDYEASTIKSELQQMTGLMRQTQCVDVPCHEK